VSAMPLSQAADADRMGRPVNHRVMVPDNPGHGIDGVHLKVTANDACNAGPDSISVRVLSRGVAIARLIAPEVAERVHPRIRFGAVVDVERIDAETCEATVEVGSRSQGDMP
jgi:hypothetical protein